MSIGSALYKLLIGPLELLFEVIFALAQRVVYHPGLAIVCLSLAMNFLVLPLYRRADALQAEERDLEASLEPWASHIKKTFKGDERFMMLQTFYRQRGYKPSYALKGSLSLLLEIPFFIAAYRFLSGLQLMSGVSFGPIRDLGAPDGLLVLGGMAINLLPILMTAINAVSAAIYMKGFPLKSKIQMYGMALIFLVLLYKSPAGLVFYWTLNNLFSLVKNIFYKLKNPGRVLRICAALAGLALLAWLVAHPFASRRKELVLAAGALLLELPLLLSWLQGRGKLPMLAEAETDDDRSFLLCGVFLAILTGLLIPTAVIKASPAEFVNINTGKSPLWYVLSATLLAAGTFVIWFGIFYRLADARTRKLFGLGAWVLAGVAVTDYMFFGTKYGDISPMLVYDTLPVNSVRDYAVNTTVLAVLALLFWLLWKKKPALVRVACLTLCCAAIGMSAANLPGIQRELRTVRADLEASREEMPVIPLSKEGKNVVILMMDRAIGYLVPFLMEEKPELKEQFAGFTFYPNAVSYGSSTNVGTPALFGGYEYRPTEINKRKDDSLKTKQNEALRLMPVLFDEAGYEVTVCDPSYAGYKGFPMDLSIYDDHPNIHAYITRGKFHVDMDLDEAEERSLNRNFFCFSIYKIAPLICQPSLYTRGLYNEADALAGARASAGAAKQTMDGLSKATGMTSRFQEYYAVLKNLAQITDVREEDKGCFLMLCNETTHDGTLVQMPDYTPAFKVDNTEYDAAHPVRYAEDGRELVLGTTVQMSQYHVNMVGMLELGNWFDYLRENGVYDNTRIIIVSDHGYRLGYEEMKFGEEKWEDATQYNCILMVKDFDAETYSTDWQFMTNADVPLMAFEGLIENPVNPATGKAVEDTAKQDPEHELQFAVLWDIAKNHDNVFKPGQWVSVHDDIYNMANWRYLGEY